MVRVLFFGALQDAAGGTAREVALVGPIGLAAFRGLVTQDDPVLAAALAAPSVRVAVNAELRADDRDLLVVPGDEVAFMPPFSGG